LTAEAAEKYREVGSMLVEAGVLAGADIDVLASYCAAWARAVEAEHEISRGGAVITYSTGIVGPSPWCKVLREALRRMDIAGDQLGIGPRSRASLAVPLKEPADPLKAFLHQASGA